jgi:tetratricopeptide (TPR) repeat protein
MKLNKIHDSDQDLLTRAKKEPEPESEHSIIEEGFFYQISVECQLLLPKKEYIVVLIEMANLCVDFGEYATAEALFTNAIDAAKEGTRFLNQAAEALQYRANILLRQARWDPAKSDLKESRQFFARAKNNVGVAKNENALGIFTAQQGNTKESVAHFKKAASLFEKAKMTDHASTAHMNLGIVSTMIGKFDEALAAYKRALPEFENAGDVRRLAELHHNVGMLFLARAEMDSAIGQFDESLNYSNQVQYEDLIGLASLGKATAYTQKKDFPLAHVFGNKAQTIFRRLNAHLSVADTYKVKGVIQREMEHFDAAELYLNTSISLNQRYNNPSNLGEAYVEMGRLRQKNGDNAKAKQAYQKSLKCFQKVGARHAVDEVKAQLHLLRN